MLWASPARDVSIALVVLQVVLASSFEYVHISTFILCVYTHTGTCTCTRMTCTWMHMYTHIHKHIKLRKEGGIADHRQVVYK